jgi:hypothetical protein
MADGSDIGLRFVTGRGRNIDILTLVKRAPAFAAPRSSLMTKPDESHDQAV